MYSSNKIYDVLDIFCELPTGNIYMGLTIYIV